VSRLPRGLRQRLLWKRRPGKAQKDGKDEELQEQVGLGTKGLPVHSYSTLQEWAGQPASPLSAHMRMCHPPPVKLVFDLQTSALLLEQSFALPSRLCLLE